MKIGTKLIFSFTFIALLAGLIGFQAYRALETISAKQAESLHFAADQQKLAQTRSDIMFIRGDIIAAVTIPKQRSFYKQRIADAAATVSQRLDSLRLSGLQDKWSSYSRDYQSVLDQLEKTEISDPGQFLYDRTINSITALLNSLTTESVASAKAQADIDAEVTTIIDDAISSTLIYSLIVLMIAIAFGLMISRHIGLPLKSLAGLSSVIASGKYDTDIPALKRQDEVGQVQGEIKKMVKNIIDLMSWYKAIIDTVPNGVAVINKGEYQLKNTAAERSGFDFQSRQQDDGKLCQSNGHFFQVSVKNLSNADGSFSNIVITNDVTILEEQRISLEKSVSVILEKMDLFASGDLTVQITGYDKGTDEISKLVRGFNKTVNQFDELLQKIVRTIKIVSDASGESSSSTEEMAASVQEQSAQLTEIASSVAEMTATITETAKNSAAMVDESSKGLSSAQEGLKLTAELEAGISSIISHTQDTSAIADELGAASKEIGNIVSFINDIADQTNLLALNAAIEAARAGEHGRGFAVVADEVRKLAEKTTSSTKEIGNMIAKVQKDADRMKASISEANSDVERGRQSAASVINSFNNILSMVKSVNSLISQVAATTEQQSAAAEQISKNAESISTVSNQTAAAVSQIAQAANNLSETSLSLQGETERFKLSHDSANKNLTLVRKQRQA